MWGWLKRDFIHHKGSRRDTKSETRHASVSGRAIFPGTARDLLSKSAKSCQAGTELCLIEKM